MSDIAKISPEQAFEVIHPFTEEGKLPMGKNKDVFCKNWERLIESGCGSIIGLFDPDLCGALGYLIFPDLNDGEICAIEAFWYVQQSKRGNGIRLFKAFENQAVEAGACRLTMVHLSSLMPEKLKRLYQRFGYQPIEEHYMKRVR